MKRRYIKIMVAISSIYNDDGDDYEEKNDEEDERTLR